MEKELAKIRERFHDDRSLSGVCAWVVGAAQVLQRGLTPPHPSAVACRL